jgi:MFS family permease
VLFVFWEARAGTRLMETANVRMRPFLGSLLASLCAGAALLITLVDVQLVAQTTMGKNSWEGTLMLTRFLVALPVGAILGGLLIKPLGERLLTFAGLLGAAAAYVLIANWPANVAQQRIDIDLVLAGLGLGLVIAPLSAVVLRVVPSSQHGIASASLVVARMMGMLIGVAALSAWGLHRFQEFTKDLIPPLPFGITDEEFNRLYAAYTEALRAALRAEYKEIFLVTAAICVLGALCALLLGSRRLTARGEEAR